MRYLKTAAELGVRGEAVFDQKILATLLYLASNRTSDSYLQHQIELLKNLSCAYEELVDIAYDHESPSIRIEALEIIALKSAPGYKVTLSDSAKADPDEMVRKHAEALLFRVIVNEHRAGGGNLAQ